MTPAAFGLVLVILAVAAVAIVATVVRNLYVCSPSEVLIFSGRRWKAGGTTWAARA